MVFAGFAAYIYIYIYIYIHIVDTFSAKQMHDPFQVIHVTQEAN